MNSRTFNLKIKGGKLIIPDDMEKYLSRCPDNIEISLVIKSESDNLAQKWNKWFDEVENLEVYHPHDNYGDLLMEKYKKQGLDL